MNKYSLPIILMLLCLTACQFGTNNSTISTRSLDEVSPPTPIETALFVFTPETTKSNMGETTPSAIPNPSAITDFAPLQNIASTNIYEIWWSDDSSTLFYGISDANIAYNIRSGESRTLSQEELLQQTPIPEIVSQLPSDSVRSFVSPEMERVLYLRFVQTPTPHNSPDSRASLRGDKATLLYYQIDGFERGLGEIEFCSFDHALWAPDEQMAVIPRSPDISMCGSTFAWLIDLETFSLLPLFPNEKYPIPVRTYALSPKGTHLIYGTFGSNDAGESVNPLYLLDLETLNSIQLSTPQVAHVEEWLTPEEILLLFTREPTLPLGFVLGIYNLSNHHLTELTSKLSDVCIRFVAVSPDRHWLAFATGTVPTCDNLNELWLMSLQLGQNE